jgi:hypothetical protein
MAPLIIVAEGKEAEGQIIQECVLYIGVLADGG